MRCPLSRRMKVPKPDTFTFAPSASELHMWCRTHSTRLADSARDSPSLRWTTSARSARVSVPLASASLLRRAIPRSAMEFVSRQRRRPPAISNYSFVTEFDRVGNSTFLRKCRYFSIPERGRAPCKATAHRFKHNDIAALDSAVLHSRVQSERNRGGGRV